MLDRDFARAQFPALASPIAFMDNAGGSQVLKTVADRISEYLLTTSVQTGASYATSVEAVARVRAARDAFALFMNGAADEIVMGPSTTILIRFLAEAMTSRLAPGDEIVLTDTDHEAHVGPFLRHEARGVRIKWWRVDPATFELSLDDLAGLLTERTKLVCVTAASNILGTLTPLRQIADMVHAVGAELSVDAVAYAPHRAIDVAASDADYTFFSVYKTFGPHFAVMHGKRDKLLALDNIYHFFFDRTKVPHKLEPGNINYELAWGSIACVDYVRALGRREGARAPRAEVEAGFRAIAASEAALGEQLLSYLTAKNRVRVIGRAGAGESERVATISFTVDGLASDRVVAVADRHDLGIRYGDFYARRLSDACGLGASNGVVRASLVHYNTPAEVDRLIAALDEAI